MCLVIQPRMLLANSLPSQGVFCRQLRALPAELLPQGPLFSAYAPARSSSLLDAFVHTEHLHVLDKALLLLSRNPCILALPSSHQLVIPFMFVSPAMMIRVQHIACSSHC